MKVKAHLMGETIRNLDKTRGKAPVVSPVGRELFVSGKTTVVGCSEPKR